jgi:hypothetical protein
MVSKTRLGKKTTKAELVKAIQAKVRKASPMIRRGAYSTKDLMKHTKAELQRRLTKARVTSRGEIELY